MTKQERQERALARRRADVQHWQKLREDHAGDHELHSTFSRKLETAKRDVHTLERKLGLSAKG